MFVECHFEFLYLSIVLKKYKMKYSARDRCMIIHASQRRLPIHFTVLLDMATYNKIIALYIAVKVRSAFMRCYAVKRTNINEFSLTDKHEKRNINHYNMGKTLMLSHCQKGHKILINARYCCWCSSVANSSKFSFKNSFKRC